MAVIMGFTGEIVLLESIDQLINHLATQVILDLLHHWSDQHHKSSDLHNSKEQLMGADYPHILSCTLVLSVTNLRLNLTISSIAHQPKQSPYQPMWARRLVSVQVQQSLFLYLSPCIDLDTCYQALNCQQHGTKPNREEGLESYGNGISPPLLSKTKAPPPPIAFRASVRKRC